MKQLYVSPLERHINSPEQIQNLIKNRLAQIDKREGMDAYLKRVNPLYKKLLKND